MKAISCILVLVVLAPLAAFRAAGPPVGKPIPADAHDLIVFHPTRPYRIRLHLRVAGEPFLAAWNRQADHLFAYLDANGDGVLSKAEAARAPSRGQWHQLSAGSAQLEPDGAPEFSVLARGKKEVSRADLRAYYSLSTAGPLQVRWARQPNTSDPLSDALFRHLDTNRDGKLSQPELEAAPRLLGRLDGNEDELVSPEEIMGRGFGISPAALIAGLPSGPARDGMPFYSLRPGDPVEPLVTALRLRYGKRNTDDLSRWVHLPPDMEVAVDLEPGRRSDIRETPVNRGTPTGRRLHEGLLMPIGNWCLELRREERSPAAMPGQPAPARELFRLMDVNGNGYLESAEIYVPPFTYVAWLRLADRDGDGRISEKEFIAFSELQMKVRGTLTFVQVEDLGRSLFRFLDSNRDGHLSLRELRDAWTRLKAWDASGAFLRSTIPQHYRVTLAHGSEKREGFAGIRRSVPLSLRGPLWFRKMDRNGDGDVSPKEFLGTTEQFRKIDLDGDGLISVEEAEACDRLMRGKTRK